MMRKSLHCAACGTQLSAPLEILSGKDPAVPEPDFEDGKPLTARGIGFKSYEPTPVFGDGVQLRFTPQYWLNPEDLTGAVRLTRNRKRLGGCCGLAGIDGPNQLCRCGAEIGTLRTDCWSPRLFIPEPTKTIWTDES
jgi:hypothetical protein